MVRGLWLFLIICLSGNFAPFGSSVRAETTEPEPARDIYITYVDLSDAPQRDWATAALTPATQSRFDNRHYSVLQTFWNLEKRGYRVHYVKRAELKELYGILSRDSTVAVFHAGHGIYLQGRPKDYYLDTFQDGERNALTPESAARVARELDHPYHPGKGLQVFYASGCRAKTCEQTVRQVFELGPDVRYFAASNADIGADEIAADLRSGEIAKWRDSLPDLGSTYLPRLLAAAESDPRLIASCFRWLNPEVGGLRDLETKFAGWISKGRQSLDKLLDDSDEDVRLGVFQLLKDHPELDQSGTSLASRGLSDPAYAVREMAMTYLETSRAGLEPYLGLLAKNAITSEPRSIPYDCELRKPLSTRAKDALRTAKDLPISAVRSLVSALYGRDEAARVTAEELLSEASANSAGLRPELLSALEVAEPRARPSLLRILGTHFAQDSSVVEPLRRALSDPEPMVRAAAISGLVAGHDQISELGEAMVETFKATSDAVVRRRLIEAASARGLTDSAADQILKMALQERDLERTALVAMPRIGTKNPELVELALQIIERSEYGNSSLAAQTLGKLGIADPRVAARLRRVMRSYNGDSSDGYHRYLSAKAARDAILGNEFVARETGCIRKGLLLLAGKRPPPLKP